MTPTPEPKNPEAPLLPDAIPPKEANPVGETRKAVEETVRKLPDAEIRKIRDEFEGHIAHSWGMNSACHIKSSHPEIDFSGEIAKALIANIQDGDISMAEEILKALAHDIDLKSLPSYEELSKAATSQFEKLIKENHFGHPKRLLELFDDKIDFRSLPYYFLLAVAILLDSFKRCAIRSEYFQESVAFYDKFCQGIDLQSIPGYAEKARGTFKKLIALGSYPDDVKNAKFFKEKFCQGIDLSSEIRGALWDNTVNHFDTKTALEIMEHFGHDTDLSPTIRLAVYTKLKEGNIDRVTWIKNELAKAEFGHDKIDLSPEIRDAFFGHLNDSRQDLDIAEQIITELGKGVDFVPTYDHGTHISHSILLFLAQERYDQAEKLWKWFGKNEKVPPIRGKINTLVSEIIVRERISDAKRVFDGFGETIKLSDGIRSGFFTLLKRGYVHSTQETKELFGDKIDLFKPPYADCLRQGFKLQLAQGRLDDAKTMREHFGEVTDLPMVLRSAFLEQIKNGKFLVAAAIAKRFDANGACFDKAFFEKKLTGIAKDFYELAVELGLEDDFANLMEKQSGYLTSLTQKKQELDMAPSEFKFVEQSGLLNLAKYHTLRDAGFSIVEFEDKEGDESWKYLWDKYQTTPEHNRNEMMDENFEEGAEVFGFKKMFSYANPFKGDFSYHDALYNFPKILDLFDISGLSPQAFFGNILQAVLDDGASYDSGTAKHHLNLVSSALEKVDIDADIRKAGEYSDIPKLKALTQGFERPEAIFASWKNLKKFHELHELLGKKEILDDLKALKGEGKEKLYGFVETLAFHPSIEMNKVIMFWKDPNQFLGLNASHTPEDVHNLKKPSNYTQVPNLDLSAEDLRDGLVEGKLDGLQSWKPFELGYRISDDPRHAELNRLPIPTLVAKAVGSRQKGIKGEAKDPKRLIGLLGEALGAQKPNEALQKLKEVIEGGSVSPEAERQLRDLISFDKSGFGLPFEEWRGKVNVKSDPDAVVAGNDTACCMPFGDGKATLYAFNPVCAQFTLQRKSKEGWRTLAQSVLTEDMLYKGDKTVDQVVGSMRGEAGHLNEVLGDEVLAQGQRTTLALDSVESNPNYTDRANLKKLYGDFFHHYLRHLYGQAPVEHDKVVLSATFNKLGELPKEPNHYIPLAPLSYSDKLGAEVCVLDVKQNATPHSETKLKAGEIKVDRGYLEKDPGFKDKRLHSLTFRDALAVSYLEGKAYADNKTLIENLHNMENGLIAKDLNNAIKGRPNLSLKFVDEKGSMRGYMLCYEGRYGQMGAPMRDEEGNEIDENANGHETTEGEPNRGEPILYVSDLARQPGHEGAGAAIVTGFLELYAREYLLKGSPIPIYAEFREQTSYKFVTRKLADLNKALGVELTAHELGTTERGGDTLHRVVIRPKT